jgi:hypothetical protein
MSSSARFISLIDLQPCDLEPEPEPPESDKEPSESDKESSKSESNDDEQSDYQPSDSDDSDSGDSELFDSDASDLDGHDDPGDSDDTETRQPPRKRQRTERTERPEPQRNYKTKEFEVVSTITRACPYLNWVHDRRIAGGCSRRRPDLLLVLETQIVIVEVDENQHSAYRPSNENERAMEISRDLGHKPIVFIRFNPDAYTTGKTNKVRHKSPWRASPTGKLTIHDKQEWNARINILRDQINYWLEHTTDKTVEVINLFFNSP